MRKALFTIIILCFSLFGSVYGQKQPPSLDSLIRVDTLHKKVLMLSLGFDAVCFIESPVGVVVIDAGISTGISSQFRHRIFEIWHREDFIYLINTHGHADHCRGASVFPEARLIRHANADAELKDYSIDSVKVAQGLLHVVGDYRDQLTLTDSNVLAWPEIYKEYLRYATALEDVKAGAGFLTADSVFQDSLHLDCGTMEIDLFYFGKSHSQSDILIHVPQLKMLFCGDLFFKYGRPGFDETELKDMPQWLKARHWLEKRMDDIEQVIGGHANLMNRDDLQAFLDRVTK